MSSLSVPVTFTKKVVDGNAMDGRSKRSVKTVRIRAYYHLEGTAIHNASGHEEKVGRPDGRATAAAARGAHKDGSATTVPIHAGREIGPPLFYRILEQLGIDLGLQLELFDCWSTSAGALR